MSINENNFSVQESVRKYTSFMGANNQMNLRIPESVLNLYQYQKFKAAFSKIMDDPAVSKARTFKIFANTISSMKINGSAEVIVVNFCHFLLRCTCNYLEVAASSRTDRNDIQVVLDRIKSLSTVFSQPCQDINAAFFDDIYKKDLSLQNKGKDFFSSNLHLFMLYNYVVRSNNTSTYQENAVVEKRYAGNCDTYFCSRAVIGLNYVNLYFFVMSMLNGINNASDFDMVYPRPIDVTRFNNSDLAMDVKQYWDLLMTAQARILEESQLVNTEFAKTLVIDDAIQKNSAQLRSLNKEFENNRMKLNVLLSNKETIEADYKKARTQLLVWALLVAIYIAIIVALFNMEIVSLPLDRKALAIIISSGLIGVFLLIREIIIYVTKP